MDGQLVRARERERASQTPYNDAWSESRLAQTATTNIDILLFRLALSGTAQ